MLNKQKIKHIIPIVSIMAVLALLCVFYVYINPFIIKTLANNFHIVSNHNNLLVHFIDVDQADAIAINLPDGKVMLIDAGSEKNNVDYTNYLKEYVLNTSKDKIIDYLVLSHADVDHVGGVLRLLKTFKVKNVFLPQIESDSKYYQEMLNQIKNKSKCEAVSGEFNINNAGYDITFLEVLEKQNTNDSSQIVKLKYLNKSFLFVGDISSNVEKDYITKYGNGIDVDVLKVSHHGSDSGTSQEFLNVVTPKFAVISCGINNSYGHPSGEVLSRLNSVNSKILRTDKHGDILFVVGKNYDLKYLVDDYTVTSLSLNYTYFIIVIEIMLFGMVVVKIIKKEKVNKHINIKNA